MVEFDLKYAVIKLADVREGLNAQEQSQLVDVMRSVRTYRESQGKGVNDYLVINTDEPYAEQVAEIMAAHKHCHQPGAGGVIISVPKLNDAAYVLACEHARDDAQIYGITRTDAEVEAEAERYRQMQHVERLAEIVHNAWWRESVRQGRSGEQSMEPYADLPDHVKEYDRVTVRAVLDALTA